MTREEIKETCAMRDVLDRYGLQANRAGFIRCPFHAGDRDASLKVYEKDWHCFACGANGDIFDFVMRMDGLTFPQAFMALGGAYEKPDYRAKLAAYKANKKRQTAQKRAQRELAEKRLNNLLISVYRRGMERSAPLSGAWCDSYNSLQYQLYKHENLNGMR